MAAPNIDIIKAKIVLLGTRIDAAQADDLRTTIITTTNDDFLRIVESELKRAESTAKDESILEQLGSLKTASENRRQSILQAKAQRDASVSTDNFDQAFSDKLNADIQFLAETTDDTTLARILASIASTKDLLSLQKAVKKMAAVRADIRLQPSDQSFVKKGLSANDWRNKLDQIDVAIQKRMIELREAKQAALNSPLDIPTGGGGGTAGPYCTIFGCYDGAAAKFFAEIGIWVLLALAIVAIIIIVILVIRSRMASNPESEKFESFSPQEDVQLKRNPVQ